MADLWGYDSSEPVQETWDRVASAAGRQPDAVGLYVSGPFAADRAAVAFLHGKGAKVWLIYDQATAESVGGGILTGMIAGHRDGTAAARAASALGAPPGTLLAADLEAGWRPSRYWIAGWTYGVCRYGYTPYLYGSVQQPPFAVEAAAARREFATVAKRLGLWDASWTAGQADTPPAWAAPGLPRWPAGGWQYQGAVTLSGAAVDLDLWRDTAGLWAPQAHTVTPPPAPELPLTVAGHTDPHTDQFVFPIVLTGARQCTLDILHDTGAFCLMLDAKTAAACGAPTGGPTLELEGVAGAAPAYWSAVDVTIEGRTWNAVACVVDPSAQGCLWGLRFYVEHGYGCAINTAKQTLTIWDGSAQALPPPP